jgi:C-terminal processing protease CtpA/Prc
MNSKNIWIPTCILTVLLLSSENAICQEVSKINHGESNISDSLFSKDLNYMEKLYGLSLLWKEIDYNFAYFSGVPELNWDQTYRDFIPRVIETKSTYAYYRELQRFCAMLKDGHTLIVGPDFVTRSIDRPKIEIQAIDKHAIIVNAGESELQQVPIGSEILKIDGISMDDYLNQKVFPYISSSTNQYLWNKGISNSLEGLKGSKVNVSIRTPSGKIENIELLRNSSLTDEKWTRKSFSNRDLLEFRWLKDSIGYLALNSFLNGQIIEDFWKNINELYRCKGLVIDLRNNGGGNSPIGYEILKQFTDKPLNDLKWYTRSHIAAYKAFGKWDKSYENYFTGNAWMKGDSDLIVPSNGRKIKAPLVVLIGPETFSAAEDFLAVMESIKKDRNIVFIGKKTGGSTGSPLFVDMPGGGTAYICAIKCTFPDGRNLIGYGVSPDIEIENTAMDIQNNVDAVLNKAFDLLLQKTGQISK